MDIRGATRPIPYVPYCAPDSPAVSLPVCCTALLPGIRARTRTAPGYTYCPGVYVLPQGIHVVHSTQCDAMLRAMVARGRGTHNSITGSIHVLTTV
jgi:hypothetical protein